MTPIREAGGPVAEQPNTPERFRAPKPALPLDVLVAIAETERKVKRLLEDIPTIPGFILLEGDVVNATNFMRVGAAEAFKTRVEYYASQSGFCRAWLDEAADETVAATLSLAVSLWTLSRYRASVPSIKEELRKTLQAQLEERLNCISEIDKQKSGTLANGSHSAPASDGGPEALEGPGFLDKPGTGEELKALALESEAASVRTASAGGDVVGAVPEPPVLDGTTSRGPGPVGGNSSQEIAEGAIIDPQQAYLTTSAILPSLDRWLHSIRCFVPEKLALQVQWQIEEDKPRIRRALLDAASQAKPNTADVPSLMGGGKSEYLDAISDLSVDLLTLVLGQLWWVTQQASPTVYDQMADDLYQDVLQFCKQRMADLDSACCNVNAPNCDDLLSPLQGELLLVRERAKEKVLLGYRLGKAVGGANRRRKDLKQSLQSYTETLARESDRDLIELAKIWAAYAELLYDSLASCYQGLSVNPVELYGESGVLAGGSTLVQVKYDIRRLRLPRPKHWPAPQNFGDDVSPSLRQSPESIVLSLPVSFTWLLDDRWFMRELLKCVHERVEYWKEKLCGNNQAASPASLAASVQYWEEKLCGNNFPQRVEETVREAGPQEPTPNNAAADVSNKPGPNTTKTAIESAKATQPPAGGARKGMPRRKPDLQTSRERAELARDLATELATVKQELRRFRTAADLRLKHPEFILWKHIEQAELEELVDGTAFTPKAYAENLTLRKYGITSRETLKKDRQKLRKAQRNHPGPPSS